MIIKIVISTPCLMTLPYDVNIARSTSIKGDFRLFQSQTVKQTLAINMTELVKIIANF